ncbi:MAG: transcription antitermination factor NusB [Clostridiales bacterium]|nr:transcription antitermination factor NusB [Clostridiales bacterium]
MTRREIREHIFLMLFRKEFYEREDLPEQIDIYLAQLEDPSTKDKQYLNNRLFAILEKVDEIDNMLSGAASGWTLSRMGKVELTILRLAVFEMSFDDDIPVKVAINEAVELAKEFGGDDTPGFVNGVLAKLT